MDAASTLTQLYTVSVDRTTRAVTITSVDPFDLLTNTGSQVSTSPWTLIGFDTSVDHTGATTFTGESAAGSKYVTQFPPQDYVAPNFKKTKVQPSVNEAASGELEIITFGTRRIIEMELLWITNKDLKSKDFFRNPTGVEDAITFMDFATTKAPMEFMEDKDIPNTFFKVILNSTEDSSNGTGFELIEEVARALPDYYKTGLLTFRIKET